MPDVTDRMIGITPSGGVSSPLPQKESFLKRVLPWFSILSVSIAALTFITNANLRRKELTFTYLGAENLVHIDRNSLKGSLSIRYQDVPINELYRLIFTIKNNGSSAIKDEDIKEPLEVTFPKGYVLLDPATVEETKPSFTLNVSRKSTDSQVLAITFPLLNPGDEARVSINALYVASSSPTLVGRIVDVRSITNIDLSKSTIDQRLPFSFVQNAKLRSTLYWFVVLYDLLFGLLCAFFTVKMCVGFIAQRRWQRQWGSLEMSIASDRREFQLAMQKSPPKLVEEYQKQSAVFEKVQADRLLAAGTPPKPQSIAENWRDFTGSFGALLTITLLSFLSLLYVITGPGV